MTLREYKYVSKNEDAFLRYCMEEAMFLKDIVGLPVNLLCDAVQMQALVILDNGMVVGKYEFKE
jgi:hypothetical protein